MTTRTSKLSLRFALAGLVAGFAAIAFFSGTPAVADDRDILRESTTKPYLFIILDTSGSMNWAPRCTAQQVADGICTYRCDTGDCMTPRSADDPASKFRQAKEALYEVLRTVDDIDIGFATYNSDDTVIKDKHWLYEVAAGQTGLPLAGGLTFPLVGGQEVFGTPVACAEGTGDGNIACFPTTANGCGAATNVCNPADIGDAWELRRLQRLPRLGTAGNVTTDTYLRVPTSNTRYKIRYTGAVTYGNPTIAVTVAVSTCTNTKCTTTTAVAGSPKVFTYNRIGDFVQYYNTLARTPVVTSHEDASFTNAGTDGAAGNSCSGWDPNTDVTADEFVNGTALSNLKQRTGMDGNPVFPSGTGGFDPPGAPDDWRFEYGDVIPLNWSISNKDAVLRRLAPRLNGGDPASDPEAFATATYMQDTKVGAETYLRAKNSSQKPLYAQGSTPLGAVLQSFRGWYRGCANTSSCNGTTGWDDFAAAHDSSWGCRRKFVLVLTDGDETCSGDPCAMTDVLDDTDGDGDGVSTFVVAFGVQTGTNTLNCMAANGGTGAPILPQNKQELVTALTGLLSQIREEASAFASAAVPQVQANASDKVFLSSFTPLGDEGFWAGRMDSYLKPLPLDANNRPDRTQVCDADTKAGCFLWDAGDVQLGFRGGGGTYAPSGFLLQAPHPDDVSANPPYVAANLQLGTADDERRVLYTQFNEPGNRKLFTYPSTTSQKYDLWAGMNIFFVVGNTASETAADNEANSVITKTLLQKEAKIQTPDPVTPGNTITTPVTYLLGDIFHADPLVVGKPADFTFYTTDPYLNKRLCGQAADPTRGPKVSYRAFADRNVCRRSVLFTAANDGQLHAFDAGILRPVGSNPAECLVPAKDLDGDGVAEVDEFGDGVIDYDLGDDVERTTKLCSTGADCESSLCLQSGFCAQKSCNVDADCASNLCTASGGSRVCSGGEGVIDGQYDNGTGREIFSFIPRPMLKSTRTLVEDHDRNKGPWGVDGSPRIDDFFIDPQASETGSTVCTNREWRSVVLGGYREGGPGYYALDVTQPDTLDSDHVPEPDNGYVPSCFGGGGSCENIPYPSVLWEFQDIQRIQISAGVFANMNLDEDLNNEIDLANSWSKMTTGRIRVCTGSCTADETEDRFVAIFGGGVGDDPAFQRGNFVYMMDVETGKIIYKKKVVGAIPADIAAVDSNGDSYIDRLYFGTTAGFIYKVQLETSLTSPMKLASQTFQTRNLAVNYNFTAERLIGPTGDTKRYDPFQVFSTGGRPIYEEVSAVYVTKLNKEAIVVGTGNRWNLWQFDGLAGRFYFVLDNDFADTDRDGVLNITCSGCTQPLTESKYTAVDPDGPDNAATALNLLYSGGGGGTLQGWYLTLQPDEKVITEAFSFAGITIFTAFQPTEISNDDGTCSRAGRSHIFLVGTVTALGYHIPTGGTLADRKRYVEVSDFTTPPFVEQSATKNPEDGNGGPSADDVSPSLKLISEELKQLQSTRCRYANYTLNIKTIRSNTGVIFIAPVPVCIDPTSWKEF
ncbi:MAG: hypothetical protein ABI639_06940 [Thermoanaerobaculia bacterium]